MDSKYEIIEHLSNLPYSCYLLENNSENLNWHDDIEIIMVLEGNLNLEIRNEKFVMSKEDIILINSNHAHRFYKNDLNSSDNSVIIIFQFSPNYFQSYYPKFSDLVFHCNSTSMHDSTGSFEILREFLLKLMWLSLNQSKMFQLEGLKTSLELVKLLVTNFVKTKSNQNFVQDQTQQRIIRVIEYINHNYDKKISLSQLAKNEYLSPNYLSKFFATHIGIGFNKYLNQFRINKSLSDLVNTNKSILEIALDHGFSNSKIYSKNFKELFKESPSEFRQKSESHIKSLTSNVSKNTLRSQEILFEHIEKYKQEKKHNFVPVVPISIDCTKKLDKNFDFEKILYFDFVYDGLNSNWQNNLIKIQKQINFDYIRFNGIFNRGMFFYSKKELSYNWFNIDNLFDFFISIDLIPFIELTYSEKEYTLKNWHILLEQFLFHCISRYGLERVSTWKFELASEDRSYEKAISLYTSTLSKLQKNFSGLNLGILFSPADNFEEREYLRNFKDKNLSFMSVEMTEDLYYKKQNLSNQLFYNIGIGMGIKVYYMSLYDENNLNDTCYDANFQIYNKLLNFKDIDTQVAFIDDLRNTNMFHGGLGLLTFNGLRKPIYNAYKLLNNLRGEIIDTGNKYFATKKDDTIRILIHNYDENDLTSYRKQKSLLSNQSYKSFKNLISSSFKRLIKLDLEVESGQYKVSIKTLSEESGCIFSQWILMGSPLKMNDEEIDFLRSREYLNIKTSIFDVKDFLHLEEIVKNNEIKLVEIKKLHSSVV